MCRMVGGVAVIADQSDLSADDVRPMLAVLAAACSATGMLR